MTTFDIYWYDLTREKQQELYELLGGENGNYDVFPIASVEFENENENKMVSIERNGEEITVPFYNIKGGDFLIDRQIVAWSNAHESGDASYDGWLFYDEDGNGWFPEDFVGR